MSPVHLSEFAGMRRELEVGLLLAPTHVAAVPAAKALAAFLDSEPTVPVRLAGLATDGGRVRLTVAVTLGSVEDIKAASDPARCALRLLQRIVDDLSAYDPAFVRLPDPASVEAELAAHISRHPDRTVLVQAVERLTTAG